MKSVEHFWKILKTDDVTTDYIWVQGSPRYQAFDRHRFNAIIWNVFKGAAGQKLHWDYHQLSMNAHIMILQEVLIDRNLFGKYALPGFELVHSATYQRRDGFREGLMIASRSPSVGSRQRILSRYKEPLVGTHKSALVCFYPLIQSEKLMVINIHSTLFRSLKTAQEEIEHLLASLPEHRGPALLAGDFNTITPKFLQMIIEKLSAYGFSHVHTDNDPRSDLRILDHIFVKGMGVENLEIIDSVKSSDHYPISCVFSF